MGIKNLTKTIRSEAPESIVNENLYKLSGKKVAVDASLLIYKQLLNNPKHKLFHNSKGKMTNHITGLFYKIMNYISLNIELIFVFDGKPPDNKQQCLDQRKQKSMKAKELSENASTEEEKNKYHKASLRLTKEIIDDVKQLLTFMGVSYIHPDAEAEAYASELCRIGYVDYVLTEDMDSLVYGCPRLIRNCLDKSIKRKDIISIINYEPMIQNMGLTDNQFIEFCILCGCDYCDSPPRVGPVTALKLIKTHKNIETIMENTSYSFPSDYTDVFQKAKENFLMFRDKINVDELVLVESKQDIDGLKDYLLNTVEMSESRVQNALKKFHNNYK
jgi:flap endonuclease-1